MASVSTWDMLGGESQTKNQVEIQEQGSKENLSLSSAIHNQFQPLSGSDLSKFCVRTSACNCYCAANEQSTIFLGVADAAWLCWGIWGQCLERLFNNMD